MSSALALQNNYIPSMDEKAINYVCKLEEIALRCPQIDIHTDHVIHGGMYARTIMVPAGTLLTGAPIRLATILILHGHTKIFIGEQTIELEGYHVIPASAGRKQAVLTITDTYFTMIFPTQVKTVKEAEEEFTEEPERLISRLNSDLNSIRITGE